MEKANKHMPSVMQLERDEINKIDFAGLSDKAIEEEHQEYVYVDASTDLHDFAWLIMWHQPLALLHSYQTPQHADP